MVPGTIEAEDYDTGGEGIAYHDSDAGNNGSQYRSDDVDIEGYSDDGGGYNVGWTEDGEWLEYTVNVAEAGTYDVDVRVASQSAGGSVSLQMNGQTVASAQSFSATGGWQDMDTQRTVSMNFWGFHPSIFDRTEKMFHQFVRDTAGQPKAEFLIPEVVDAMIKEGTGHCSVLTSNDKWYGVTYQEDKHMVVDAFKKLVADGVYPERLWS